MTDLDKIYEFFEHQAFLIEEEFGTYNWTSLPPNVTPKDILNDNKPLLWPYPETLRWKYRFLAHWYEYVEPLKEMVLSEVKEINAKEKVSNEDVSYIKNWWYNIILKKAQSGEGGSIDSPLHWIRDLYDSPPEGVTCLSYLQEVIERELKEDGFNSWLEDLEKHVMLHFFFVKLIVKLREVLTTKISFAVYAIIGIVIGIIGSVVGILNYVK